MSEDPALRPWTRRALRLLAAGLLALASPVHAGGPMRLPATPQAPPDAAYHPTDGYLTTREGRPLLWYRGATQRPEESHQDVRAWAFELPPEVRYEPAQGGLVLRTPGGRTRRLAREVVDRWTPPGTRFVPEPGVRLTADEGWRVRLEVDPGGPPGDGPTD